MCDNYSGGSRQALQLQVCLTADSRNRHCMSHRQVKCARWSVLTPWNCSESLVLAKQAIAQLNAYSGMQLGEMAESPEHTARSGRSISLRW